MIKAEVLTRPQVKDGRSSVYQALYPCRWIIDFGPNHKVYQTSGKGLDLSLIRGYVANDDRTKVLGY